MSSNLPKAQELLRLFKCVVDTGADVLVPFAEDKLLKSYNGNFERFLDDKKHEIFHLWHSKKLLCCACPPTGCTLKRTGHIDNWIFEKMYDGVGSEHGGHTIRNSGKVVQMCLHKYVTRNIGIHELDIVALSFLLQNFATLLPNEDTALVTIKRNRNSICHAYSTDCYDVTFLNTAWTELENSLVDLTYPSYRGVIKKQINYLRKVNLEKEEITQLFKHVQEVNTALKEVNACLTLNNNAIEKCEVNLKTTVLEESLAIQQHLSYESNAMQRAQTVLLQEALSSKAEAKDREDKILDQIGILNTNQSSSSLEISEQLKKIVEMFNLSHNNTSFSIKYEQSKGSSEGQECLVLWQLATPENWNAVEIEEILTKFEDKFKDLPMKIKFAKQGSLVIMTTVSAEVLKEPSAFKSAIKTFLTRMVEVCKIDTTVKSTVDVTLHILSSDKWNLTYKLQDELLNDKSVQTEDTDYEHQMRMKRHWNKDEHFDLAFLNSDNQREIKWVHNVSSMLELEYNIKCTIPSKDYLYGFPLNDKLMRYLNKFKAVILTVTTENYAQCKSYVDDKSSFIIVELDYINEIPSEFWKYSYINCTTCEHLWFPQLIDTLKTKLPDHLRKRRDNDKNEQDVECEKCNSSSKTAVYHKVGIENKILRTTLFATFCGSLTDETWILNFLNQKTDFMKPCKMFAWCKSLDRNIRGELPSNFYVCVSPNIHKCPSIEGYVNFLVKDKHINVYLLKIASTRTPSFLIHLPNCIDATTMDQRELAYQLILTDELEKRYMHDSVHNMRSFREYDISMGKGRFRLPDQSVDETESLNLAKKDKYELANDTISLRDYFGLSRPDHFVEEIESLKLLDKEKEFTLDHFDEIQKESLKLLEKEKDLALDDSVDETKSLIMTERENESSLVHSQSEVFPPSEDSSLYERRSSNRSNTSMEKEEITRTVSPPSEDSALYERRSSNRSITSMEKEEVTRTVTPRSDDISVYERRSSIRSNTSMEKEEVTRTDPNCIIL